LTRYAKFSVKKYQNFKKNNEKTTAVSALQDKKLTKNYDLT